MARETRSGAVGRRAGTRDLRGVRGESKREGGRWGGKREEREREKEIPASSHTYAIRTLGCTRKECVSRSRVCEVRNGLKRAERAQSQSWSHPRDPRQAAPASVPSVVVAVVASTPSEYRVPRRQRVRLVPGCEPHTVRRSFTSRR